MPEVFLEKSHKVAISETAISEAAISEAAISEAAISEAARGEERERRASGCPRQLIDLTAPIDLN